MVTWSGRAVSHRRAIPRAVRARLATGDERDQPWTGSRRNRVLKRKRLDLNGEKVHWVGSITTDREAAWPGQTKTTTLWSLAVLGWTQGMEAQAG